MLLKMDNAFCLTAIKKNLSPENVARQLNQAYAEMKNDKNGVFSRLYVKQLQIEAINKLKHQKKEETETLNNGEHLTQSGVRSYKTHDIGEKYLRNEAF